MCKKLIYCLFGVLLFWSIGCTNGSPKNETENIVVMDTVITEVTDTVTIIDPETSVETVKILSRFDTVIVERKE